jgi:hypothetical protein
MLTVPSPCFSEPSCSQLNIDAVTRRVEDVSESPAVGIFEPWTIFKAHLAAYPQSSELGRLCEALFASLGGIYSEETYSTDTGIDCVAVYYSSYFHKLAVRTIDRSLRWFIRNR